jgi:hypothetical protein
MKTTCFLAAAPLILAAYAANASPTVVIDPNNSIVADGVNGIYVNGYSYNVTFVNGIVDHTFDGDSGAQSTAESDLESALNATSVTYVHEAGSSINNFVVGNPSDGGTLLLTSGSAGTWQSGPSGSGYTTEALFTPSIAPTVVLLNSQVVSEVDNVSVDGKLYDVTFQYGAVDNTFTGDPAEQAVAESVLENALNQTTAAYVHEYFGSINGFDIDDPSNGGMELISYGNVGQWQLGGSGSGTASEAVFTAVPEPGTWALMIVGMGLAGATLRRRASKTAQA